MSEPVERRSSLAWGFRSLGEWRLVFLLAVTTALLALPSALALWSALHSVFGRTLAGDHVLRNHPLFAPADALEFLEERRDALAAAALTSVGAAALSLLLQILFAGGFVEVLARLPRARLGPFFEGAFRNFWHNLKCFAIFAVSAAVLIALWLGAADAASSRIFEQSPPGAPAPRIVRLVIWLVALLLFAVLALLHDFARIARRHDPSVGAWSGFATARRLLGSAWLPAFGLFLFWLLVGGGAWLSILALEWGTPAVSALAILLHTLLQAFAVVIRSGVRVAAWGSYVALADRRTERHPGESSAAARTEPEAGLPPPDLVGEAPLI